MKAGEKVMVYLDPFTCERPEGRATLLKKGDAAPMNEVSYWLVRFDGDIDTRAKYWRWVKETA